MTQVARQELENLSEDIPECNVIYLPQVGGAGEGQGRGMRGEGIGPGSLLSPYCLPPLQLGYLLAIPRGEHVTNQDDFEIEGLEFVVGGH